jgi:hypothetical protein
LNFIGFLWVRASDFLEKCLDGKSVGVIEMPRL